MKTITLSLKALLLLLMLGLFATVAHADGPFVGPQNFFGQTNQELDFTIITPGYYAVTLDGYLQVEGYWGSGYATITTTIDGANVSLPILSTGWPGGLSCQNSIYYFSAGPHVILGSPNLVVIQPPGPPNNSPEDQEHFDNSTMWQYTVQSADSDNCSQALTDLQNQVTALEGSVNDLGTNNASALASQNQQLTDINSALSTVQAALVSNQELTDALSNQITSLQNQVIQIETSNFNTLENQITTLQNTVDQQNAFEQQIFVGQPNQELDFTITIPGYYDVTIDSNFLFFGYAPDSAYAILGTTIDGAAAPMVSPYAVLRDGVTAMNKSCSSTQYFAAGPHTISANMNFFNLNNYTVTDNSTWTYTVKPTQ